MHSKLSITKKLLLIAPSVVLLFFFYKLAMIYLVLIFGYFAYVEFGRKEKEQV